MTPNETVAHNLRRALARLRGMTQRQAAEAISLHASTRWSVESYAQAERSARGERSRRFDADELYALAAAFELPVTFFLGDGFAVFTDPAELDQAADRLRHQANELRRVADAFAGEFESLAGTFSTTARAIRQGPPRPGGAYPASWHEEES